MRFVKESCTKYDFFSVYSNYISSVSTKYPDYFCPCKNNCRLGQIMLVIGRKSSQKCYKDKY